MTEWLPWQSKRSHQRDLSASRHLGDRRNPSGQHVLVPQTQRADTSGLQEAFVLRNVVTGTIDLHDEILFRQVEVRDTVGGCVEPALLFKAKPSRSEVLFEGSLRGCRLLQELSTVLPVPLFVL